MKKHALICLAIGVGTVCQAGPLIYAPNSLYNTVSTMDDLIVFDADDPAGYTVIGPLTATNITFGGMDFAADGTLYAYASLFRTTGGAASGLYRINPETAEATPIGNSPQSLDDIAYNPVDGQMYGVRSQAGTPRVYRINLTSGLVTQVGLISGLPTQAQIVGMAIDSEGRFYYHDVGADKIFRGTAQSVSELHTIPQDTVFSQGMTIDWSADDQGYHAAVGQGEFPNYFSQLNTFGPGGYVLGPVFGPNIPGAGGFTYPPIECGDLAIAPRLGGCSEADFVEPFGTLDFFDVSGFLGAFNAQDVAADLNEDGAFNFFDVSAFLAAFNAGCP